MRQNAKLFPTTSAEFLKAKRRIDESSGGKKIKNWHTELTMRQDFIKDIQKIRKQHGLPKNGLPQKSFMLSPAGFIMEDLKERSIFESSLRIIGKKYGVETMTIPCALESYIFYNSFDYISTGPNESSFFKVVDMPEDKLEPINSSCASEADELWPVAIRVSPHASKNDLLSFIEAVYSTMIKPVQDRYKSPDNKLGKIRTKNPAVQERNQFIFDNLKMNRSELAKVVNAKFHTSFVYSDINSIIQAERRRRGMNI